MTPHSNCCTAFLNPVVRLVALLRGGQGYRAVASKCTKNAQAMLALTQQLQVKVDRRGYIAAIGVEPERSGNPLCSGSAIQLMCLTMPRLTVWCYTCMKRLVPMSKHLQEGS